MKFAGVFAPLVSPRNACGQIDLADVTRQVDYVRPWVHGVVPAIGCGEGWLLEFADWRALLDRVVEEACGLQVIAGCCAPNWDELFARVRFAANCGADAVMVALPAGLGTGESHEELLDRLSEVRSAISVQVAFYWEQFISDRALSAQECADICDVLRAVAVKDSMRSPAATLRLKEIKGSLSILQGWEDLLAEGLPINGYIGPLALLSDLPRRLFDSSEGWGGVHEEANALGLLDADYVSRVTGELQTRGILTGSGRG